jgi:HAD superfamily hydrolase (TIGR01509 family)
MKYKAIIFDMDGTIADTEEIWQKATHQLILNKGISVDPKTQEDLVTQLRGSCTSKSCEIIKNVLKSSDTLEDLINEKSRLAWQFYSESIKFIKGFEDFFKKVKSLKLKTALATNADDKSLHLTNKYLNLEKFFGKHIYNITHVNNKSKPLPDIYLYAADKLKVNPKECIVIEDSDHGIKAAKDAGMFCIGINTAGKPELLKKADMIINEFSEIDLKKLISTK